MGDALRDGALLEFGEVEAGAEVRAFAGEDDYPDMLGHIKEGHVQLRDQGVVQCIAFFRGQPLGIPAL